MYASYPLAQFCPAIPKTPGIYALVNAANHHVYVGSTRNFANRRRNHFRDLKSGKHKNAHLQSAYTYYGASVFTFVILEHVALEQHLTLREQHYMYLLAPEYNIAPQAGRTAGIKRSPEFMANLTAAAAAANRGRKRSPEYGVRLSPLLKAARQARLLDNPDAYKPSSEALAKKAATHLAKVEAGEYVAPNQGRRRTPESIAKQRATVRAKVEAGEYTAWNKGEKQSPGLIEKRIAPLRGRERSPESVSQMVATKRAKREADSEYGFVRRVKSPEERAKISAANTGRKRSPEVIARRTATRKANREAKLAALEQSQPTLWELNE